MRFWNCEFWIFTPVCVYYNSTMPFLFPEFDRQLQWSSSAFTLRPKRHQATLLGLLQNSPTHHGYSSSRCYFPAAGTHGYTQTRVQPGQSSFFRVRKKNFLLLLRETNKNEIKFFVCDKKKWGRTIYSLGSAFLVDARFVITCVFSGLIAFMSAWGQNDIQVISFPTCFSRPAAEAFCSSLLILPKRKRTKKVVRAESKVLLWVLKVE